MNEQDRYHYHYHYRDHRDIMAAILETLSSDDTGANITRLVYGTGAQWSSLLLMLVQLRENKMIVEKALPRMKLKGTRNHRIFFITPKGIKFLQLYRELKAYLNNGNELNEAE